MFNQRRTKMKKAFETEVMKEACNICEDEVETCAKCYEHLDSECFYCDDFGEHYCEKCNAFIEKTKTYKSEPKEDKG